MPHKANKKTTTKNHRKAHKKTSSKKHRTNKRTMRGGMYPEPQMPNYFHMDRRENQDLQRQVVQRQQEQARQQAMEAQYQNEERMRLERMSQAGREIAMKKNDEESQRNAIRFIRNVVDGNDVNMKKMLAEECKPLIEGSSLTSLYKSAASLVPSFSIFGKKQQPQVEPQMRSRVSVFESEDD
jgi:hypothetical protein